MKRTKILITGVALSAIALVGSLAFNSKISNIVSGDADEVWTHYTGVDATCENKGIREYWVGCSFHGHQFTAPLSYVRIDEGGAPSQAFIDALDPSDDRLIAKHDLGSLEYQIDDDNNVYKMCPTCGKTTYGKATVITLEQDYTDEHGFHYHPAASADFPMALNTELPCLNPSVFKTNVSNLLTFKVRTAKIASFLVPDASPLVARSFLAFKDKFICQYNGTFYAFNMPGQIRTPNGKTALIGKELNTIKASRAIYGDHVMVDFVSSTSLFAGNTDLNWTCGGDWSTNWFITQTRDGVTTDVSNVPSTPGGAFSSPLNTIQFYCKTTGENPQPLAVPFIRVDFKVSDLQEGDILTIKAGTVFSSSQKSNPLIMDAVLEDIVLRFDGKFVGSDIRSSAAPTDMNHWAPGSIGHLRFNGLNFYGPYATNRSYSMTDIRGVKYKVAGGSAELDSTFSMAYWNHQGGFNGLQIASAHGGVYSEGDQIIFEAGNVSAMINLDDGDYRGYCIFDTGFVLEYKNTEDKGLQWEIATK